MSLDNETIVFTASVARAIKTKRFFSDMTMTRLAKEAGMSQQMISCIERGVRVPTIASLYRIARALGVPASEVLAEAEMMKR